MLVTQFRSFFPGWTTCNILHFTYIEIHTLPYTLPDILNWFIFLRKRKMKRRQESKPYSEVIVWDKVLTGNFHLVNPLALLSNRQEWNPSRPLFRPRLRVQAKPRLRAAIPLPSKLALMYPRSQKTPAQPHHWLLPAISLKTRLECLVKETTRGPR